MTDVRWGILGTGHIAERAFLPALGEAGGGRPVLVASRDGSRADAFATRHGIERAVEGYERLLADPGIEAVYIALPNALHRRWTEAALEAKVPVLCEKPLCGTTEDTEAVLDAARRAGTPLWEAFVFPFHQQMAVVRGLVAEGVIGELREIQSSFHFELPEPHDIRRSTELHGGSLRDVGCYPVRLSRLLFAAEPDRASASAVWGDSGVDEEMAGELGFPEDHRLLFSCGFRLAYDTFTRLLGTAGAVHLMNPFHPRTGDTIEVIAGGERRIRQAAVEHHTFTPALRHVHSVVRGEAEPLHLAVDEALGNARAIDLLIASAQAG